MIPALSLAGSLLEAAALPQSSSLVPTGSAAAQNSDFNQIFAGVGAAIDNLKNGESASILGLQGQASVQHVVESVMSAERSLQTVIAVRDKIVSAYQALSQMAI